jgi:hypothetical protein
MGRPIPSDWKLPSRSISPGDRRREKIAKAMERRAPKEVFSIIYHFASLLLCTYNFHDSFMKIEIIKKTS